MAIIPERKRHFIFAVATLIVCAQLFLIGERNKATKIQEPNVCPKCPQTCEICPARPTDWRSIDAESMSPKQLVDYLHWTNRSSCGLTHDFGGFMRFEPSAFDGNKAVCLDQGVAPVPNRCLVYSFGINNEWSFDDTMERYGCEVFSFDPSMNMKDHDRTAKIHFSGIGLSDTDTIVPGNNWTVKRLKTIYEDLHHQGRTIDYLKMDIESAEWAVLKDMMSSGMLKRVRQLGVEVHFGLDMSLASYRSKVGILKSIEDAGFRRFDSKYNPWCNQTVPQLDNYKGSLCFEIAWYQTNLNQ